METRRPRETATSLLPSIMAVSQTAQPSASKPFPPPNFKNRLDFFSTKEVTKSQPRHPLSPLRDALGSIDRNASQSTRISAAIPRPSPHPDIFTSQSPRANRFNENFTRKRPLEDSNIPAKRPRTEEVATGQRKKPIDEKWISRWLKMFPTLVIHFEEGADASRLRQRAIRLGATIDPFFSHTVTHLIVKALGTPHPPSHLAAKAADMGIKVWSLKKLGELVSNISPVESATNSLQSLLEDERLHGTRERDLSAPRADHYYFKPGNKYTLIEDATGRHRPIMVKEYAPNPKDGPEWPVLHETFLRVSSNTLPSVDLRARAWSLYVDRVPFEGERPLGELRRTISMRNIAGTPELPQPQPYQIASGNSVVVTSNIASTSNANPSPNTTVMARKEIKQMSKRVQVLKGNAAARRDQPNDLFAPPQRRASTGMPFQQKTFMTQDQVVNMLRQARQPNDDVATREMRIVNHEKVYSRKEDAASGYCENCRLRYADLSIHLASKKHRRFAHDDANFVELDQLLDTLRRPCIGNLPCTHDDTEECMACQRSLAEAEDEEFEDAEEEEEEADSER